MNLSDYVESGAVPPTSIINGHSDTISSTSVLHDPSSVAGSQRYGKIIYSGALTANTFKTILTVSGKGVIKLCTLVCVDATSRIFNVRVTIDGTAAITTALNTAVTNAYTSVTAVGSYIYTTYGFAYERIPFNSSFAVDVKSSLSETNKLYAIMAYEVQ